MDENNNDRDDVLDNEDTGSSSSSFKDNIDSSFERSVFKEFFTLIESESDTKNLRLKCNLCPPAAKRTYGCATNSTANLKKHLQTIHPSSHDKLQSLKRSSQSDTSVVPKKQQTISGMFNNNGRTVISQAMLNDLIISFVVGDMQSFSVVESPEFVQLITTLLPGRSVMTRKTLTEHMKQKYDRMKDSLQQQLTSATAVCTTADLWTSHNRSFFGTTVHWIDNETLVRQSAALACKRIKGKHTYDLIASTLEEIHTKYHIVDKVVCTVTDNGSNFVKAFKVFSVSETGAINVNQEAEATSDSDDGDSEVVFTDVSEILSRNEPTEYVLPPHHRCSAHTMNLVAVRDSENANESDSFKKLSRSVFAKCSGLWNKSSKSPQAAEAIYERSEITLMVPTVTRWNSFFHAVSKVYSIVEKKSETVLNDVCLNLSLPIFRSNEITFMAEYIKVRHPVAAALDALQAENQCYMGVLLPTISSLRARLCSLKPTLNLMGPLVDALLDGINTRFGSFEAKDELIVASVSHPQFKLRWIQSDSSRVHARYLMTRAMQTQANAISNNTNVPSTSNDSNSFFYFYELDQCEGNTITAELELFLNDGSRDMVSLNRFPVVKEVFIKTNTSLPSSAPVERLFSIAGQILTPCRNRLTDENFETALLLRANKKLELQHE